MNTSTIYEGELVDAARLLARAHVLCGFTVADDDILAQLDRREIGDPMRQLIINAYRETAEDEQS